ncbi:hypothetical protein PoB_007675800 [Plakobranchus ocellatus]|uniref:Uncharacterized protein n=1 Tax=Plakobranchus ocellatus TaxID=259542 RepID=A0AAV4E119_9GAST|nr:hypothetical protein PoB_007675800 [Plakobranchus ocellatus]
MGPRDPPTPSKLNSHYQSTAKCPNITETNRTKVNETVATTFAFSLAYTSSSTADQFPTSTLRTRYFNARSRKTQRRWQYLAEGTTGTATLSLLKSSGSSTRPVKYRTRSSGIFAGSAGAVCQCPGWNYIRRGSPPRATRGDKKIKIIGIKSYTFVPPCMRAELHNNGPRDFREQEIRESRDSGLISSLKNHLKAFDPSGQFLLVISSGKSHKISSRFKGKWHNDVDDDDDDDDDDNKQQQHRR